MWWTLRLKNLAFISQPTTRVEWTLPTNQLAVFSLILQLTTWQQTENAFKLDSFQTISPSGASHLKAGSFFEFWNAKFYFKNRFLTKLKRKIKIQNQVSPKAGTIPVRLLTKSASINGFMLMNHPEHWVPAFQGLVGLIKQGKLQSKETFFI